MKAKPILLATAVLLAAGGWWLARSNWGRPANDEPTSEAGLRGSQQINFDPNDTASASPASQNGSSLPERNNRPQPGHNLRPPDPSRRFAEFTPEQRVQFARQGHGPGG